jgi:ligand-binding sensor domain-containing protein
MIDAPMARLAPLLLAAALGAVRVSADAAPGLDPAKALTQYGLDVWTIDEGLPQNTVTSLAQTPDGFVWVGTYNGLARFDGVRFHTFDRREHQPLGAGGITGLAADPAGRLFVGPQRGGLATVEGGRSSATVDDPELARRTVRSLLVDAGGTWVGTNAGLLRLEGASTRVVPGSEDLVINALAPDGAGGLYVGTHGLGLWRLAADGRWTTWRAGDGPGSDLVACLARCGSAPSGRASRD